MSSRQRVEVLLANLGGYRNVTLAKGDIARLVSEDPQAVCADWTQT